MTVQVVQTAPARECKCGNCKATLKYEFADIKAEYSRDYDGGGDWCYTIVCPACRKPVFVHKW